MKKQIWLVFLAVLVLALSAISVQAAIVGCINSTDQPVSDNTGGWPKYNDTGTITNVTEGKVCINTTNYDVNSSSGAYCTIYHDCAISSCSAQNVALGYLGNGTNTCTQTNRQLLAGSIYIASGYRVIVNEVAASCNESAVAVPVYSSCTNLYTKNGTNGLCNGAGVFTGNTTPVAVGKVCMNGSSVAPNTTYNCGTWYECIAGDTTYDSFYTGFDGIGSGCTATSWVATGTTVTLGTGQSVATTLNSSAPCSEYNSALTSGCSNTRTLVFAAFGLLAVGIIILAAFALIKFSDASNLMVIAITGIGLAIVLFIGYFIMSAVQTAICVGL